MDKEKNTSLTETSPSDENKIILLRIEESESVDRETLIKKLVIDESLEKCSLLGISKMDQPRKKYLLVPASLMEFGETQKQLMQEDDNYQREFMCTLEHNGKNYFVYKPAAPRNKKWVKARVLLDGILSMSIGRILTLIVSYFVLFELITTIASAFTEENTRSGLLFAAISLVSLVLGLISTDCCQAWYKYHGMVGYWKYYNEPRVVEQSSYPKEFVRAEVTRVVRTRVKGTKLYIEGYRIIAGRCKRHFMSRLTEIQYLDAEKKTGVLFYWFKGADNMFEESRHIDGFCVLKWDKTTGSINELGGWYAGIKSQSLGRVHFRRISKEEYQALKNIVF